MNNIDRAAKTINDTIGIQEVSAESIAYELFKAGLLAPEPKIIRTREEIADLDPDTMLISTVEPAHPFPAEEPQEMMARGRRVGIGWIPSVVIATGNQVRAAQQALKEES